MESFLSTYLAQSAAASAALAQDEGALPMLQGMVRVIVASLRSGGKLLVAGNGGSAADAQHIAAEFVSRLMFDRAPLAALALSESGPILTACGNDYGFASVFARQVAALGRAGDVLLALSTSGNSKNLLDAAAAARAQGMITLGLAGRSGGLMPGAFDHVLRAPADNAQIVQQLHMAAAHAILGAVESALFAKAPTT
jgi:D-sedoheptulose 7-phosphate isomerase